MFVGGALSAFVTGNYGISIACIIIAILVFDEGKKK
jgi:hypothetical protein